MRWLKKINRGAVLFAAVFLIAMAGIIVTSAIRFAHAAQAESVVTRILEAVNQNSLAEDGDWNASFDQEDFRSQWVSARAEEAGRAIDPYVMPETALSAITAFMENRVDVLCESAEMDVMFDQVTFLSEGIRLNVSLSWRGQGHSGRPVEQYGTMTFLMVKDGRSGWKASFFRLDSMTENMILRNSVMPEISLQAVQAAGRKEGVL